MDSYLISLNQKGLIPGPDESEEAFQERCQYCLSLKNVFSEQLEYETFDKDQDPIFASSLEQTKKIMISLLIGFLSFIAIKNFHFGMVDVLGFFSLKKLLQQLPYYS